MRRGIFKGVLFLFLFLITVTVVYLEGGCSARVPQTVEDDSRARQTTALDISSEKNGRVRIALRPAFGQLHFDEPVYMLQSPNDNQNWYVVEKGGKVYRASNAGSGRKALFVDISGRADSSSSESGLLGMAFHPDFETNGYVYLSYTARGTPLISRISRFKSYDGGRTVAPDSEQVILSLRQPFVNHNGGMITFGPDGYLYAGFGDGGSAGDPQNNAQDTGTLLGKIIRIDVNGKGGRMYSIPPDNPFVSKKGARPEIFAYGLRNPWRFSFDRKTGALWAADVGQDKWEEVDLIKKGANYGWNIKEGSHCFRVNPCSFRYLTDPVIEYSHSDGHAITGGYVYRGNRWENIAGHYFYADFVSGRIWSIPDPYVRIPAPIRMLDTKLNISSFAEGNDGELYVLDFNSGKVFNIAESR